MPLCHIRWNAKFFNPIPIWAALTQNAQRLGINSNELSKSLAPTGIAIDTRARILESVVQDAKTQIGTLLKSIPDQELQRRMARLNDKVVYGVLRSVDAFFFESLSLRRLVERFYVSVLRRAKLETGQQAHSNFRMLVQQTETQVGFEWGKYLGGNRNLFMHETAPYLAVEFKAENLGKRELVIESNPDVYLRSTDFNNVLDGLSLLLDRCRDDLVRKIQQPSQARESGAEE